MPFHASRIAHIGIAVKDLNDALKLYHESLGLACSGREVVSGDQVEIAFLPIGDTEIELLEATTPDSPVARFIEKRGEGIHHLAIEVDDIESTMATMKAQGYRLIDESPRVGAGGSRVAFLHPKSAGGVLIELCESNRV